MFRYAIFRVCFFVKRLLGEYSGGRTVVTGEKFLIREKQALKKGNLATYTNSRVQSCFLSYVSDMLVH